MPINVLPRHLVNKIAAGEVIERPASVVKELAENALDAGATRVDIVLEDGGRKLIAISDDGAGMDHGDLSLAFVPHATSKITVEDDLFGIHTMGFRGEALASIASISHAHIRTRRKADPGGHEIDASGETVGQPRPCAAAPGTTVTVRDLFFNTPARRKFLKAAPTELSHISEQLARLALPGAPVAFSLTHNNRLTQSLPATTSTAQRVSDLFGAELAQGLLPVSPRRAGPLSVSGLVGQPGAARATARWQYFFLNGRYIRDRLLAHALREAYRGLLDPSRQPVAFIFLDIDPAEVDVNVHPTKVEVRFRDSQAVHSALLAALRETLNRSNLTPSIQLTDATSAKGTPALGDQTDDFGSSADQSHSAAPTPLPAGTLPSAELPDDERRNSLRQAMADFFRSAPQPQPRLAFPTDHPRRGADGADSLTDAAAPFFAGLPSNPSTPPATDSPARAIAPVQFHNSYIVAQTPDGLVIIDQHALHERILYNEFRDRLSAGALAGQRLLIPQTLSVSPAEAAAAQAHQPLLESLGIELESFGPSTLAIQQFPPMLTGRGVKPLEFVREILDQLADDAAADSERLLESILETMACKAAVKAGDPLSPAEIQALLERSQDTQKCSSCPHGRPTTIRLTLKDLEKQFKRT